MASSATVGALKVVLSADSAQFSAGLKEAQGFAQKFGAVLGNVAGIAAAFSAATVAAAGIAAVQLRKVANEADEMGKAAQKVGIMTEELSALKYTADLAGVGFENLQTSLVRLTKAMSEVAKGGDGDAAKAFQVLGISVTNADGSLRGVSDVMGDVAQKFSEFRDGAEKTALAVAIFGKSGAEMIPLLNMGRDAIAESNEEAKKFGVTLSADLARDSERFNDNLSRLHYALQGLWVAIANEAIPVLADFSDKMVEWAKKAEVFKIGAEFVRNELLAFQEAPERTTSSYLVATSFWLGARPRSRCRSRVMARRKSMGIALYSATTSTREASGLYVVKIER